MSNASFCPRPTHHSTHIVPGARSTDIYFAPSPSHQTRTHSKHQSLSHCKECKPTITVPTKFEKKTMKQLIIALLTIHATAVKMDDLHKSNATIEVDQRLVGPKSSKIFVGKGSKSSPISRSKQSTKNAKSLKTEIDNSSTSRGEQLGENLSSVTLGNSTNADTNEKDVTQYLADDDSNELRSRNLVTGLAGLLALLAGIVAVIAMKRRRRRRAKSNVLHSVEITPVETVRRDKAPQITDDTDYACGDLFGMTKCLA